MSQQDEQKAVRLGFLAFKEFERGYRGGLLVTDSRGKPLEFRCTSPIRPTQVQRILYGRSLIPYIAVQLIGVPLTNSATEKPTLIVVSHDVFLELRESIHQPVLFVRRQGDAIRTGSRSEGLPEFEPVLLECEGARFDPIVVESHRRHPEEALQSRHQLREIFDHLDLLEPFERVARALDEVERQKAVDS